MSDAASTLTVNDSKDKKSIFKPAGAGKPISLMVTEAVSNARKSKKLFVGGTWLYLLLNIACGVILAWADASSKGGVPEAFVFLGGKDLYNIVSNVDKLVLFVFIGFVFFMDNVPGRDSSEETKGDILVIAISFVVAYLAFNATYVVRLITIMPANVAVSAPIVRELVGNALSIGFLLWFLKWLFSLTVRINKAAASKQP